MIRVAWSDLLRRGIHGRVLGKRDALESFAFESFASKTPASQNGAHVLGNVLRNASKSRAAAAFFFCISAAALLTSCRRQAPSNVDRNRAPETYVTGAPAESLVSYYRSHIYWSGRDPDGTIAYYEIAVIDSNRVPGQDLDQGTGYTKTTKTDSTFVFKASPSTDQQLLGYRFFVRAVDNQGKVDPTPAVAYFVARNDNFPEIVFRPGLASWTDRFGNTLTRVLTSTDPDSPTDTIGVEGCFSQTWTGFDGDPGGFVVRYEYKLASQLSYQGGTLADTSFQYCFPPGVSRKQLLQVRSVDDGGLRSPFDFTRSVVVNFDPLTFVVRPPDPENPGAAPEPARFFREGETDWPSGTTLPDDVYDDLKVYFTGYDDSREKQPTWDLDRGISQFDTRVMYRVDSDLNFGGPPFEKSLADSLVYPRPNGHAFTQLGSGDHLILIRARDKQLVADSTPDSVVVSINYRPYVVLLTARPESAPASEAIDLLNTSPTEIVTFLLSPGEKLLVTVLGADDHHVTPEPGSAEDLYDPNTVVRDEVRGGIDPQGGYRAYLSNAVAAPSYDGAPAGQNYTVALDVDSYGEFQLVAQVRDRTNTNDTRTGRTGTVVRTIRLEAR